MVTVLLAVYNGEKYLSAQIESILCQTEQNFKIIIRDDGSRDNSPAIIKEYAEKYPDKISVMKGTPTGSAATNFATMLEVCDDDYIMFCDQDDVWLPFKIEKTLAAMKSAEGDNKNIPVLVHGDLSVVDEKLNITAPSFFKFQRLYQQNVSFPHLLVQNYVTGCTVMINRALKQKCGSVPENCAMHDWWLALIAQLFGKIVCINEPLMLYRQHTDNQVGAKASYGFALIRRKLATLGEVKKNYQATYTQAEILKTRYLNELDESDSEILSAYCSMKRKNKLQKLCLMNKYDFKKGTTLRIIGQYFLM